MGCRNTPSRCPPRRSIAVWDRVLRMSVCQTRRSAPEPSNARLIMINFDSVLTPVRQNRRAIHVWPIAIERSTGSIS